MFVMKERYKSYYENEIKIPGDDPYILYMQQVICPIKAETMPIMIKVYLKFQNGCFIRYLAEFFFFKTRRTYKYGHFCLNCIIFFDLGSYEIIV